MMTYYKITYYRYLGTNSILLFILTINFANLTESNFAGFRRRKLFLNYYRAYCESEQNAYLHLTRLLYI